MNNIGQAIKEFRKKKLLKQKDLANKSGISQTYLSQIETGDKFPSLDMLEKICNALDIPPQIITFLSLDENSIKEEKREAFKVLVPSIQAMVSKFFL
jgi:transcriptional regulator with XRE-family HTH domain